jgi:hypothetical protein
MLPKGKFICMLKRKTNDSTAEIGMNFAYIAINVGNFNREANFRENATSLNKTPDLFIIITVIQDIN